MGVKWIKKNNQQVYIYVVIWVYQIFQSFVFDLFNGDALS